MPYSTSVPRKRVAPLNELALAIRIGSPGATSVHPTASAAQIAAASTGLPPALAPALPLGPADPLGVVVHAARTRSMAVKTALQRKIFRIQ
jgi:hypothetical protein